MRLHVHKRPGIGNDYCLKCGRAPESNENEARIDELLKLSINTNPNYTIGMYIEKRIETLRKLAKPNQ